ncbi:MAG: transrane and repeat-containing protein, partial [Myxococcales bacterium]|nr:transrane and repeat-containing protein [Myxococcales bacterium]
LAAWAVGPRVAAARQGRPLFALGLDENVVPLDAIRFATEHGLRARMYNDFEIGSYLLFEGPPRHPVFVDPRLPAYPPEFHALLGRADVTRDEWSAAMERYGVDAALLAYAGLNRRVAWWDPARWALVYRAHDARVFVRRSPERDALIAEREVPATFAFTAAEGTTTLPLAERPAASPVSACEWQRRLGDLLFELDGAASPRTRAAYARALADAGCLEASRDAKLCAWLGALELQAGHFDAADTLLTRALRDGDPELTTRANRAFAWEALGRRRDAMAAWTDVAARARGTPLADVAAKRIAALR